MVDKLFDFNQSKEPEPEEEKVINLAEVKKGSKIVIKIQKGPILEFTVNTPINKEKEQKFIKGDLKVIDTENNWSSWVVLLGTVFMHKEICDFNQLITGGHLCFDIRRQKNNEELKNLPSYFTPYNIESNKVEFYSIYPSLRSYSWRSIITRRIEEINPENIIETKK